MTPLAGTVITLGASDTAAFIKHCIKHSQPVFVAGDPGIGKSDVIRQVADELYGDSAAIAAATLAGANIERLYLRDIRASLYESVDLRGLPHIVNGVTRWTIPSILPVIGQPDTPDAGMMFWDELNRAVPSVQNALLQMILDRALADYRLPPGWQQVAAGNMNDVGVGKMPSASKSRFARVNMVANVDDWLCWAKRANIDPAIRLYLRDHADQLHRYDPKADAFPSPRTWAFVARLLDASLPANVERALIAGCIGETYLPGVWGYLTMVRTMAGHIDLAALRAAPDTYQVPSSPSLAYAVANGLAQSTDHANVAATFTYLARMPVEFAVFAAGAIVKRDPTLKQTRALTVWYAQHADSY